MKEGTKPEMIKATYAVTFEFPVKRPVTIRGNVEAWQPHSLFQRAVKEAKKEARKTKQSIVGWSSISTLIDRYEQILNRRNLTSSET